MIDPLAVSFGQQLDRFKNVVVKSWAWPSPSIGFSLHVFDANREAIPFEMGELTTPERNRFQEAPVLAAIGYTLSLSLSAGERSASTLDAWADGLDRLSFRKAFPLDRESFVFRPLELLGIALGAAHCREVSQIAMTWLIKVVIESEQRLIGGELWRSILGACAAIVLEQAWKPIVIPPVNQLAVQDIALIRWLSTAYPSVSYQMNGSMDTLEHSLMERCAVAEVTPQDSSQASLLYFALRHSVTRLLGFATEGGTSMSSVSAVSSTTPRVFISYSHDCDAWKNLGRDPETQKKRVFDLAERLRSEGVLCIIDQQTANPPEGWPRWMMNQIEESDFVVVISTEIYNQRFRGKGKAGKGLGSQWEGAIITQELYDDAGKNEKFVPVVFEQADTAHIPIPLRSATHYNLSSNEGYDNLYFYLTHQPVYQHKPLGPIRKRSI